MSIMMQKYIPKSLLISLILVAFAVLPKASLAAHLQLAVASNFREVMPSIAQLFETQSDHTMSISFASTGKHYAQILNGAPFDLFLAADSERPQRLILENKAIAESLSTYAIGKLVLWSPDAKLIDAEASTLKSDDFYFLAIANPRLAPYGRAAKQVLEGRGLWNSLSKRIVRGENINQAFQYVRSGNAQLGFVGLAQIKAAGQTSKGSYWLVPQALYSPIVQQLVRLTDSEASQSFASFMHSEEVMEILQQYGYDTPNAE